MQDRSIQNLLNGYRAGTWNVRQVICEVMQDIRKTDEHAAWITVLDDAALEPYLTRLETQSPDALPLYGIPFAVKDNIDVAGIPTTAACPDYRYLPDTSAFVVDCLVAAGAIPVGKTNLDQFATGLVGTRSPYGVCRNAIDAEYVSGGSSSGSAVSVALGQVSFALGTDTAGSGRVPASFNNLVGLKPTRGLLSSRGVVPACRSLDTISIFALTTADAARVLDIAAVHDAVDAYARPMAIPRLGRALIPETGFHFGIPRTDQLEFFGEPEYPRLFTDTVANLRALGGTAHEIDFSPFLETARLLYEGPWVAERYAAIETLIETHPEALMDVTRTIIGGARNLGAVATFKAQYRLEALRRTSESVWDDIDFIVTPTAARMPTIAEVQRDPLGVNSQLGHYTNFMNLLDLAAVAVPAGWRSNQLPFGVTLFAPAFRDRELLPIADRLHRVRSHSAGATEHPLPPPQNWAQPTEHVIKVAVCGAHLSGLPLNHQLTERRGCLLAVTETAPEYRLFALPGGPPHRPGLIRAPGEGNAIAVEVWALPADRFGEFVDQIPAPLGIGRILLANGEIVAGFLCEPHAVINAREITSLGSWRSFLDTTDMSTLTN
jgi:allophanate hydrolase